MHKGFGTIYILVGVLVIAIIAGGIYFIGRPDVKPSQSQTPTQKACTEEAKQCPDGSYVSRVGPNCEFAECPSPSATPSPSDETANWKTYTNIKHKFSFKYPPNLKSFSPIDDLSDGIGLADMSTVLPSSDASYNGIGVAFNPLSSWGYSDNETQALSFEAYMKLVRETFPYGQGCSPEEGQEEVVIIDDQQGILFKGYCEGINAVYLQVPNTHKVIRITENEVSKASFNLVFKRILSTFKFL